MCPGPSKDDIRAAALGERIPAGSEKASSMYLELVYRLVRSLDPARRRPVRLEV